jgi:CRP/FNR family transcriptional regulator, polysaccharide utilization system transcription regulator
MIKPDFNIAEHHCPDCKFKSPLFCHLTDRELDLVEDNKKTVVFRKGETIRKQGTAMTHVASINSGLAKMYIEGINNQQSIIRIIKPTGFIGGPGIYLDQINHYTVSALTETTVCFIELALFKDLIDNNKVFAHALMKDFSQIILSVYNRLVFLTQKKMNGRMADTLLYLFEEIMQSNKFEMHFSKQDIADLSAMAKESAIKILREFQKSGIVNISANEIELIDVDALRWISKTG